MKSEEKKPPTTTRPLSVSMMPSMPLMTQSILLELSPVDKDHSLNSERLLLSSLNTLSNSERLLLINQSLRLSLKSPKKMLINQPLKD
jgi:hypothetical protein